MKHEAIQKVFDGKLMHQIKEKSGFGELIDELKSIFRKDHDHIWKDKHTRKVREERAIDEDVEWFYRHRDKTFTRDEFQRERHISDSEIGPLWDAYEADRVIIYVGGGTATASIKKSGSPKDGKYRVNPEFIVNLDKAVKKAKETAGKKSKPEEDSPAERSDRLERSLAAPEEPEAPTAPEAAPEEPKAPTVDEPRVIPAQSLPKLSKRWHKQVALALVKSNMPVKKLMALSGGKTVRLKETLLYLEKQGFPIKGQDVGGTLTYYFDPKVKYNEKKDLFFIPKHTASAVAWLGEVLHGEINRLAMLHRASILRPDKVKSPLDK